MPVFQKHIARSKLDIYVFITLNKIIIENLLLPILLPLYLEFRKENKQDKKK
jgi:hypothetical protein